MKKLGIILLFLIAAGAAAWYFLLREEGIPGFDRKPYPELSVGLENRVQIHDEGKGTAAIRAMNRTDLLYGQGLLHGNRGGGALESLRALFRGKPGSGPDPETARLAELFYFLDLESVAAESWSLYPAQVQVLITAYARGLSESKETETTWTVEDVLLMQRGYAFLMGRNLAKGWTAERLNRNVGGALTALIGFVWGEPGGLPESARASAGLTPLFSPFLETVHLDDGAAQRVIQTRVRPSLAWAFLPMVLELEGTRGIEGLSLVGQPFLISGRNTALTWHSQAVLADDEQFFEVARAAYLGQGDRIETREHATHFSSYGSAPVHGSLGRMIGRLISAREDADIWYHWDGFRPSADLTTAYLLMDAQTIEEAITATQYHQVPPVELFLSNREGRRVRLACRPSEATVPFAERTDRLFSGPRVAYLPVVAVRGTDFEERKAELVDPARAARSRVDTELIEVLRLFLRDRRAAATIGEEKRAGLQALLTGGRTGARDALIHDAWSSLADWLDQRQPLGLDLAMKRYVLANLSRQAGAVGAVALPRARRGELIEAMAVDVSVSPEPDYEIVTARGASGIREDVPAQSPDAPGGAWFIDRRKRVASVTTYAVYPGEVSVAWRYPFVEKGKLGPPIREDFSVRVRQPHVIAPAMVR